MSTKQGSLDDWQNRDPLSKTCLAWPNKTKLRRGVASLCKYIRGIKHRVGEEQFKGQRWHKNK